nr:uncharacterized protein LOC127337257 [Lolium perenne]
MAFPWSNGGVCGSPGVLARLLASGVGEGRLGASALVTPWRVQGARRAHTGAETERCSPPPAAASSSPPGASPRPPLLCIAARTRAPAPASGESRTGGHGGAEGEDEGKAQAVLPGAGDGDVHATAPLHGSRGKSPRTCNGSRGGHPGRAAAPRAAAEEVESMDITEDGCPARRAEGRPASARSWQASRAGDGGAGNPFSMAPPPASSPRRGEGIGTGWERERRQRRPNRSSASLTAPPESALAAGASR